ncbi:hypothetical protein RJ640_017690 [Escallonia rubra]|uniref:SHSP domain-containing protein n=1 Tax=Escallonia rubra TaxID=112253 RepID=A0AA88QD97_9ASTE|nr:hypothetical protein RJ640_017690 [Escallonia rubra]
MPGVGKENVKVYMEQNTLVIKGEAESESDDKEPATRYASRLDLHPNTYKFDKTPNTYKFDEIKADMKNGVLWCSFVFPASMMGSSVGFSDGVWPAGDGVLSGEVLVVQVSADES